MRPSSPSGDRSSRLRLVAPFVCLALLTACGTTSQSARLESPAETGRSATPGTTPSDVPTSTAEVEVERDGLDPAVVTGVRYATHDGYDRVVIDLKGDIPGYKVQWVKEFLEDGSGEPIGVRGGAYLQLTLFPANAHDDDGYPTWKGGPVYPANLKNVGDVVRTGDFEGRVGIGLALARRAGFQVKEQSGPSRLVLDVAH
ncbi:hypothetical protein ACIBIZ_01080 [Nonomuraea spiralis]|uniref:AMIN-like domain-containing (lipo)protein n=1 Tax=Nonomuraea TaxID=83681 RepID=UPI000F7A0A98|nr:hypothetical protein [Nonomuraea sp. WAC 01424]RSN00230.1 hypothetical protein DMB42_40625 [Nonomuraea sp. WAC 01424]